MTSFELVFTAAGGAAKNVWLIAHGLGDSYAGWEPAVPYLQPDPDTTVVLVNAPEAYYDGFSWYPIPDLSHPHADRSDMIAGVHSSLALLQGTIDELAAEWAIPTNYWSLIGFSQGCAMVLETALRGAPFRCVVGISGYLPTIDEYPDAFGKAAQATPILVTHGRYDPVVPFERSEAMSEFLTEQNCNITFTAYNKAHELDIHNEVPAIRAFLHNPT